MGVPGSLQIRNNNCNKSAKKRFGPSQDCTDEKDLETTLTGEIEVEVASRNMKVSAEAWRAFQVYQQYEDWSSETEKTDYTYSRLSQFRHREVIPGFPVRPNLCRSPIKASTPNSLFDYTSELEQQNHSNSIKIRNLQVKRDILSEFGSDGSHTEYVSYYHRFLQVLTISWTLMLTSSQKAFERLGVLVSNFSSVFAGYFVSIWSLTAFCFSSFCLSVVRGWKKIKQRMSFSSDQQTTIRSTWRDYIETSWIRIITRTMVTFVTTTYYRSFKKENTYRIKYISLLLIPLLLIAGLGVYYYSIDPATIALSILSKTYEFVTPTIPSDVSVEAPQLIYDILWHNLLSLVNEIIPQFFFKTVPYYVITFIPDLFTVLMPQYFWAACDTFSSLGILLFTYLKLSSVVESSYSYILFFFTYGTTYLYSFYVWLWLNIVFVISSFGVSLLWLNDFAFSSILLIYESLVNLFNFCWILESSDAEKPNFVGPETLIDVPPLET